MEPIEIVNIVPVVDIGAESWLRKIILTARVIKIVRGELKAITIFYYPLRRHFQIKLGLCSWAGGTLTFHFFSIFLAMTQTNEWSWTAKTLIFYSLVLKVNRALMNYTKREICEPIKGRSEWTCGWMRSQLLAGEGKSTLCCMLYEHRGLDGTAEDGDVMNVGHVDGGGHPGNVDGARRQPIYHNVTLEDVTWRYNDHIFSLGVSDTETRCVTSRSSCGFWWSYGSCFAAHWRSRSWFGRFPSLKGKNDFTRFFKNS